VESISLKQGADVLPEGCEWHFDRENGEESGNLLLLAGKHNGIVVALIERNQFSSWNLVLDAHRDPERQVRMTTASIAEAIDIVELWASLNKDRLMRFV
jgi:hypothetical protein